MYCSEEKDSGQSSDWGYRSRQSAHAWQNLPIDPGVQLVVGVDATGQTGQFPRRREFIWLCASIKRRFPSNTLSPVWILRIKFYYY